MRGSERSVFMDMESCAPGSQLEANEAKKPKQPLMTEIVERQSQMESALIALHTGLSEIRDRLLGPPVPQKEGEGSKNQENPMGFMPITSVHQRGTLRVVRKCSRLVSEILAELS